MAYQTEKIFTKITIFLYFHDYMVHLVPSKVIIEAIQISKLVISLFTFAVNSVSYRCGINLIIRFINGILT